MVVTVVSVVVVATLDAVPCLLSSSCSHILIHSYIVRAMSHRPMSSSPSPGTPGMMGVSISHWRQVPSISSLSANECCGLKASSQVASGAPGGRPSSS